MSYSSINRCANDPSFLARLDACVAQEQGVRNEVPAPYKYREAFRWIVSSASDVEAAYESALAANNPDPGGDESVITDGMILAPVQANWDGVAASTPQIPVSF